MTMKILLLALLCGACDGGGATVSQTNDNRDDHQGIGSGTLQPVATPFFTDDCSRQCVRLADGTWQLTVDCQGQPIRTFIVGVLPPNCDLISELTPVVTTAGGFTGQTAGGGQ